MLSMFQGKKGFSVLFTSRESQLASPRPAAPGHEARTSVTPPASSRQSSHRCERCARLFRVDNTVAATDLLCRRCEFVACPLCQEVQVTAEDGSVLQWQCCVCAMPPTLMRLFEQTRQGPSLVLRVMAFCDPRAERVLRSLFRTVSTTPSARLGHAAATAGHPSARALPASKRIAQHAREARKSGTLATETSHASDDVEPRVSTGSKGLRQRSKSGANQQPLQRSKTTHRCTIHEDSEEAAVTQAENVITGSLERTMMDALTFAPTTEASRTVTQLTSSPSVGAFGLDVSVSAAALVSVSEASHSRSIGPVAGLAASGSSAPVAGSGAPGAKSRSSAAFEREQPITPRTNVSAETRMTRTDGPALSLSPLPKDTRARSPSSESECSARSASPAPRFPSYTEFLGDQDAVRYMNGARLTNGEALTVSPDSDDDNDDDDGRVGGDVVELGAKRPSRTLNAAASGQRTSGLLATAEAQASTPTNRTRRTIHDGSAKRASTAKARRRSSSSRVRRSASGFTPRSVYKRHSSRRSTSRLTAHSIASSAAPSLPLYQPVASASVSAVRASGGSAVGAEVGHRPAPAPAAPLGKRRATTATTTTKTRSGTAVAATAPRRAPLATRTAGRVLGAGGGKSSGTSTPLNNSLHAVPSGSRPPVAGRFGRTNSGTTGSGFQRTASTTNTKLTRTASSSKYLSSTAAAPSAALKRTNSSAKHMTSPQALVRTQSRRATSPPSAATGDKSPALGTRLTRTQSSTAGAFARTKSGNKLTRTASTAAGTGIAPAGGARLKRTATATTTPLKRTKSANPAAYARSATSAATAAAVRARSGSQAQATPKRLVRVGSAHTPLTRTAGTTRASPKSGTPLRRTATATPTRPAGTAARAATPLTRTATAAGRFERKATQTRLGSTGASPSALVEDAPKLVHLTTRRAAGPGVATKPTKTAGATGTTPQRFGRTATRTKAVRTSAEPSCTGTEHGSLARSSDGHAPAAHKTPTRRAAGSAAVASQHTEKVPRRAGAVSPSAATTPSGAAPFRRQNSSRTAFGRQPSRNPALQK